jgi:outer membrane protein assembly factor BamB
MKLFSVLIILIFIHHCSFDNKTGIWKNENSLPEEKNDIFKEFKTLSSTSTPFEKIIPIDKNFKFLLSNPTTNTKWNDIYFSESNNYKNFKYNDLNKYIYKSKKLTKYKINNSILLNDNNLIISDIKGNLIIFSITKNKVITKYNFYKKKYKHIPKTLNFIVEKKIIYVSDNIGFLYAFDMNKNKIIWAKNYKIPFKSNLKISNNKLIAANQNNDLLFFEKENGDTLRQIPTEQTTVKNEFINNLSLHNEKLFFLNTYGSLYSVNTKKMNINWFINLNQSLDLKPSKLFTGSKIINYKNKLVVSSNNFTYVLDNSSGTIIFKKNFSSLVKPIVYNGYLFLITKKNLLIAMNLNNTSIIYSYDIKERIFNFVNLKKKNLEYNGLFIVNNKIFIFLKDSHLLKFDLNGEIKSVNRLKPKTNSKPIFVNNSMMFLDFKNKLTIID